MSVLARTMKPRGQREREHRRSKKGQQVFIQSIAMNEVGAGRDRATGGKEGLVKANHPKG